MISACDLLPDDPGADGTIRQAACGTSRKKLYRAFKRRAEGAPRRGRDLRRIRPVRMIRTKEWKYVHRYPYGKHELYHLVDDPGEEKNLYGLPEYKKTGNSIKAGRMEKWFCTYSDPAIDGVRSAVNGSGQLCRPGVYAIYEDPFSPNGVE